jgi:Protein of unknown function (DUF2505)
MGTRFSIVHEFDCDATTYWEIFWDEAFNADQYPKLGCGRKLLLKEDKGETLIRDQEVSPEREVPAILRKFMAGALRYHEHGVFKKPLGPLDVTIKTPALGERFEMRAQYVVTDIAPGRCRRDFRGECTVKVPLVGGAAEKAILSNMRETYDNAAKVHREWIAKRAPRV